MEKRKVVPNVTSMLPARSFSSVTSAAFIQAFPNNVLLYQSIPRIIGIIAATRMIRKFILGISFFFKDILIPKSKRKTDKSPLDKNTNQLSVVC